MNRNNNNWPYQKFHDTSKSNSRNNPTWSSRFYEYNDSGEIKKSHLKWGPKTANSPGSYIDKASCTCRIEEYSSLSIISLSN